MPELARNYSPSAVYCITKEIIQWQIQKMNNTIEELDNWPKQNNKED